MQTSRSAAYQVRPAPEEYGLLELLFSNPESRVLGFTLFGPVKINC